jgi:putative ABC transport system substrate-binding protein
MARQNAEALIVKRETIFQEQRNQIVDLAAKHRLPSVGGYGEYAEAGGLMSYGQNLSENPRRAATYVDKIFKGTKPGDISVEQPTTFELFINRKTATALGIKVPQSLVAQATKVIE